MILLKNKKECGEVIFENGVFISNKYSVRTIDKIKFICVNCKKEVQKEIRKFKKPITSESFKCGPCIRREFYLSKYGVENPQQIKEVKEKTKKTVKERYGGDAPICNEKIKSKIKKTNLEKYGVENVFQNEEIKKKIKETIVKKYGVENPMYAEEVKEKSKEVRLINFFNKLDTRTNQLVSPMFNYKKLKKVTSDRKNKVLWKCNKCGSIFEDHLCSGHIPRCVKCFPIYKNNVSKKEDELKDFVESLGLECEKFYFKNNGSGRKKELDIYIPDKNIAIEFNGLYWHSEGKLAERIERPKYFHLDKTKLSKENGIRLIHIFEDEWLFKQEIVENRLKSIFGIHENRIGGRETIIKEIKVKEKNNFLNLYHIQGEDKSSIKLGAFRDSKLISVMTFCKPRIALGQKIKEENIFELSRFVSVPNTSTPGIASKLLNHFIKNYKPKKIYTYSDRRWNTGNLYTNLGFENKGTTGPNYWYVVQGRRFHRFGFRKQRLQTLLENFNPDLTEYQNMLNNGYDRIWDCGNDKWELNL